MTAICIGGPHDGLAITAKKLPRRRKLNVYGDMAMSGRYVLAHYELRDGAYHFVRTKEGKRTRRFTLPGNVAFRDAK